jgi:hypothetical protein
VVGGVIRVWDDRTDGMWRVDDPDRLASLMARGTVARTLVEARRSREALLFDPDSNVLVVTGRPMTHSDSASIETDAVTFQLEAGEPIRTEFFREFADRMGNAALAAARRGELIVVEKGGWTHHPEPYVLAAVLNRDGEYLSHIETSPVPVGAEYWPPSGSEEAGQTLTAPASERQVQLGGHLIADAVTCWGLSPWDIAVTYVASPSGPWTP